MNRHQLGQIFFLASIVTLVIFPFTGVYASIVDSTRGRILLQVQDNGEAWYVNPVNDDRYYLGRPEAALQVLQDVGLGISNDDLVKIPIGLTNELAAIDSDGDGLSDPLEVSIGTSPGQSDTDGDGYNDYTEILNGFNPLNSTFGAGQSIDNALIDQLAGRIVLQVHLNGEAWYVNPVDRKRYYMGHPDVTHLVMSELGLGITNSDLNVIGIGNGSLLPSDTDSTPEEEVIIETPVEELVVEVPVEEDIVVELVIEPIVNEPVDVPVDDIGPTWNEIIDGSFTNYSTTLDPSGDLVLTNENYKVRIFDHEAEDYGKYILSQLKVCTEEISEIIGQDPFTTWPVSWKVGFGEKRYTRCCEADPDLYIVSFFNNEDSFDAIAHGDGIFWRRVDIDHNICHWGHEEVHRVLLGSSFSLLDDTAFIVNAWANEGLATYLENRFKSREDGPFAPYVECREDGFMYLNEFVSLVDVSGNIFQSDYSSIYGYATGMCFWDHIITNYGEPRFKQIITNTYNPNIEATGNFIDDYVAPATGDSIYDFTEKIGFPNPNG